MAGRYRLDELIGRGPSGEVWRAHDERADWTVAVKILAAGTRQELTDHAQAVARVVHPNVAMVLDIGEHDEAPFLVMEFLTGQSLGEELAERGPLPIVEVCDLVGQAAAGLDAAHRAGSCTARSSRTASAAPAAASSRPSGSPSTRICRSPATAPRAARRQRPARLRPLRARLRRLRTAVRPPAVHRLRRRAGRSAPRHRPRAAARPPRRDPRRTGPARAGAAHQGSRRPPRER